MGSRIRNVIYLLEGESLGQGDQEVRIYKGASAESSPNEEPVLRRISFTASDWALLQDTTWSLADSRARSIERQPSGEHRPAHGSFFAFLASEAALSVLL